MSVSERLKKLEQRPQPQQPQRPHGMTQEALKKHMEGLTLPGLTAFIRTMTDGDLSASFEYFSSHAQNLITSMA